MNPCRNEPKKNSILFPPHGLGRTHKGMRANKETMQLINRKATTYLIGAQVAALCVGYILRSPDLSATAQRQASIRNQQTETAFERSQAIQRAQTCLILASELPITDGTAAYFSSLKMVVSSSTKNVHYPMALVSVMSSEILGLSLRMLKEFLLSATSNVCHRKR